jgi:hypothetical protein
VKVIFTYLLLLSFSCYSQDKRQTKTNYLILGLLQDYNGRSFYTSIKDRVDYFYPFEKPLVEFIDSLLSAENRKPELLNRRGRFSIISKPLAKFVNSFYTFTTDSSYILSDTLNDEEELVYLGRLNIPIVDDPINLRYFIAGNYIRFGEKVGDYDSLTFVNSVSKALCFLKLITRLGCTEITTRVISGGTPGRTTIKFKPTAEIRDCLEKYEYLRKKIAGSFLDFYRPRKLPAS